MAFTNNMSNLINKIERRLEVRGIKLPEEFTKDKWADIIYEDTLPTFSRFFPYKMTLLITPDMRSPHPGEEDTFLINEHQIPGGGKIYGFKDINWEKLINSPTGSNSAYGYYGYGDDMCSFEDFIDVQMQADSMSLYNNGIYPTFIPPNKIKFENAVGVDVASSLGVFPIEVYFQHPKNLQTIPPTCMETFENLAIADVAIFLKPLKYYDGLTTIFGGEVDLKMDKIEEYANGRDNQIDMLEQNYVNPCNTNQVIIATMN